MAKNEEKAVEAIKAYMLRQNRPYSAIDVMTNLHKAFGKTLVVKTLETLTEAGILKEKCVGKQKIYFPNQDQFPSFDESELKSLEQSLCAAQELSQTKQSAVRAAESELRDLSSAPSNAGLEKNAEALKDEITSLERKLAQLRSSDQRVSPEELKNARQQHELAAKEWRKRKRMCINMLNAILEGYPKSKKELFEEIGVETDEDLGVIPPVP